MAVSKKASTTGRTFIKLVVLCLALASCQVNARGRGRGGPHPLRGRGFPHPPRGRGFPHPPRGRGFPHPLRGRGVPHPPRGRGFPHPSRGGGVPHPPRGRGIPHPPRRGGVPHQPRRGGVPHPPRRGGVPHPPRRGFAPVDYGIIHNVLQFGAKPGGSQISTQAFVKAWRAACDSPAKSTVLVPPGVFTLAETIFEGPCKSPFPVTFLLQGTVRAVPDVSEYTDKWWISFDTVNGLVITGGGTFDGQGPAVWKYNDCKGNSGCVHLAASLYFNGVQNAKLKGVNFLNSMGFHMHITNSKVIRMNGLHITAPPDSPNTDGMHISKSETVRVSKSVIRTGDDCISVGQGAINVTVNKVTCGPGHGISVGSLGKLPNELDVRGVIVKNCTLVGTTNGIRIKTWPGSDPSKAGGMLFSNIVMDNVKNPIIIDQNYGTKSNKPSLVKISDVIYQDIKGTAASPLAVSLNCSPRAPCENVSLRNINLRPKANNLRLTSTCLHAKVGFTGIQFPPPCHH